MFPIFSGIATAQASTARLAVAFIEDGSVPFTQEIITPVPGGGSYTTAAGELDVSVVATGGDESYSYAWTLNEFDDSGNNFAVNTVGTTNQARYDTARFNGVAGSPPNESYWNAICTVTDGTGATAQVDLEFNLAGIQV